ncbi:4Fe-4S ferredoxin [Pelomyxa schiedti]|nr:4Fe-4S ferredoxin [Pelomyxa schiedti]
MPPHGTHHYNNVNVPAVPNRRAVSFLPTIVSCVLCSMCALRWGSLPLPLRLFLVPLVLLTALDARYRLVQHRGLLLALRAWANGKHPVGYTRFINGLAKIFGQRVIAAATDRYHGKVLTPEHARTMVTWTKCCIERSDLGERVLPFSVARDLVMRGPPEIALVNCECRELKKVHCEPLEVCMVMGRELLDRFPSAKRITIPEAIEVLKAAHNNGNVHTAWFAELHENSMFAICNCCKCCCSGIETMRRYGFTAGNMVSSGYSSRRKEGSTCVGCGACEKLCAFDAIHLKLAAEQGGRPQAYVDTDKCLGCGVCVAKCPKKCLELTRDPSKPAPLDLNELF